MEARRFRSSAFWKNDVSSARSFPQNFVSVIYYVGNIICRKQDGNQSGREASTTGSKHDGKTPKLDENPNFGIMKFSMKPKDREIFTAKVRIQNVVY